MAHMKHLLSNFVSDESGQDLIEYALVAAIIALGAITSMKGVATAVNNIFTNIGTTLNNN